MSRNFTPPPPALFELECPPAPNLTRARKAQTHRVNIHEMGRQIQKLIHRVIGAGEVVPDLYDFIQSWTVILIALQIFDIQLVHAPSWGGNPVYFIRYRGRLYTSHAIVVPEREGIDLLVEARWNPTIARLINTRFRHMKNWLGLDAPFSNFLCEHQRETALDEAIAILESDLPL